MIYFGQKHTQNTYKKERKGEKTEKQRGKKMWVNQVFVFLIPAGFVSDLK